MDTILARTFSVRPENKIAMRCPPWPDTPLHRYFGAKKSKKKNMDFVLSSLGYVRLYEYGCEKSTNQPGDSGFNSTFVHLEERHRADGPYTLYSKTQRRLGLGLNERAREKRLLRYYKYFKGFQRKLQVSRQFQQPSQKHANKEAQVNKIINFYQPSSKTVQESEKGIKSQDIVGRNAVEAVIKTAIPKNPLLAEASSQDKKEVKREKNNALSNKKTPDIPFAECATTNKQPVLMSSLDSYNTGQKSKERCSIISTILETVDENKGELDGNSENTESVNDSKYFSDISFMTMACDDSIYKKSKEPLKLRGILKHSPSKSIRQEVKFIENEDGSFMAIPTGKASGDMHNQVQQEPTRKTEQFLLGSTSPYDRVKRYTGDSSQSTYGELIMSKAGTLKRVLSKKEGRIRPVLQRTSQTSVSSFTAGVENERTESELALESPPAESEEPVVDSRDHKVAFKKRQVMRVRKTLTPKKSVTPKQSIKTTDQVYQRKKSRKSHAMIKFQGWDFGAPLAAHSLKKLPGEADLSQQILTRGEKLKWDMLQQIECDYDDLPPRSPLMSKDPRDYVEENGILRIFEHLTQKVLTEEPTSSLDLLQDAARDLAQKREQKTNIYEDLKQMRNTTMPLQPCNYTEIHPLSAKVKVILKPKYRISAPKPNTSSSNPNNGTPRSSKLESECRSDLN